MSTDTIIRDLLKRDLALDIKNITNPTAPLDAVLPPYKTVGHILMHNLCGVMVGISRDAFTLAMAFDRLESNNRHARHLIIDRDGTIYRIASLTTALAYTEPLGGLNCSNIVSIELINAGRIFPDHTKSTVLLQNNTYRHVIKRSSMKLADQGVYYENFNYHQSDSLLFILHALRNLLPSLKFVDCGFWESQRDFRLTPVFPKRFGIFLA
jgi:hypothetical protein